MIHPISYDSVHGRIVNHWHRRDGQIAMKVTIPPNTSATSFVPSTNEAAVTESGRLPSQAEGVNFLRIEGHAAVYAVRSGTYRFQSTLPEGIQ